MSKNTRNYIILPACLLLLNAFEEVVVYKIKRYPEIAGNPYLITFIIILMFAIGFSLVGDFFAPYIQTLFEQMHKKSKKHGGDYGIIIFYILCAGIVFFVYFRIYTIGVASVLPQAWR